MDTSRGAEGLRPRRLPLGHGGARRLASPLREP